MFADMMESQFFEMEKKFHLFDLKTDDGIPIWDIMRHDLYCNYFLSGITHKKRNFWTLFKVFFCGIPIIFRSGISLFFRKSDNLVFSYSRYIDKNGLLFDKASESIIQALSGNVIIIERIKALNKYKHKIEYNMVGIYRALFRKQEKIPTSVYEKIEFALRDTYGIVLTTYDELNRWYSNFVMDYHFYCLLFKLKKTKRVFVVQNGIQKGLFYACRSLGVLSYELQHGSIARENMLYSDINYLDNANNVIFSDFFLTMGNYWTKSITAPVHILPVGNDSFAAPDFVEKSDHSLLFISSMMHGEELSKIALHYAEKHSDIIINFKLHAHEYNDINKYRKYFNGFSNIQVLKNEIDIQKLIARAEVIVLISSTVLFEALNQNAKVAIYKKCDYINQSECFDLPNVYLFDTIEELEYIYKAKKDSNITFFEKFNKQVFENLIKM